MNLVPSLKACQNWLKKSVAPYNLDQLPFFPTLEIPPKADATTILPGPQVESCSSGGTARRLAGKSLAVSPIEIRPSKIKTIAEGKMGVSIKTIPKIRGVKYKAGP